MRRRNKLAETGSEPMTDPSIHRPKIVSIFNRKNAIMFTASLVIFLTTLMIFAVTNYRATQESEDNLAVHAAMNRVSNLFDSMSESVSEIYFKSLNVSLLRYRMGNGNNSKDVINISTNLMQTGSPKNLTRNMLMLKYFLQNSTPYIRFNTSGFSTETNLTIAKGILFSKTERNSTKGEIIKMYYNLSGETQNPIWNVSLYFRSTERMRTIAWNGSAAPTGSVNYYIQTRDTGTPYTENTTFTVGIITGTNSYTMQIYNTSSRLINITFDNEKFMIDQILGNYNLTIELWMNATGRNITYTIGDDKLIDVNISNFGARKRGKATFT